jgi:hypothetical protein
LSSVISIYSLPHPFLAYLIYPPDGKHKEPQLQHREQQHNQPATTTDLGASFGDASSYATNHATDHGQHAAEPIDITVASERQAWRNPEDQATHFFPLRGTSGR